MEFSGALILLQGILRESCRDSSGVSRESGYLSGGDAWGLDFYPFPTLFQGLLLFFILCIGLFSAQDSSQTKDCTKNKKFENHWPNFFHWIYSQLLFIVVQPTRLVFGQQDNRAIWSRGWHQAPRVQQRGPLKLSPQLKGSSLVFDKDLSWSKLALFVAQDFFGGRYH